MDRKELKEKIFLQVNKKENQWDSVARTATDKIMLLIDLYIEGREKEKIPTEKIAWKEKVCLQIKTSYTLLNQLYRKGWSEEDVDNNIEPFIDLNYPDCRDATLKVVRHFFNSMNKRKLNRKSEI